MDGLTRRTETQYDDAALRPPLVNYRPQERWEDVFSERCSSAAKCEAATHARIWLDKGNVKDKRVSGKHDVDFNGQHLEGTFLVKYRQ